MNDDDEEQTSEMVLDYHTSGDTASINWITSTENVSLDINNEGAAVFEWEVDEPTTTTTDPMTTTTEPMTKTSQVAAPQRVTPRFAG